MPLKYMHTMNGKPAYFCPKEGEIFFSGRGRFNAVRLVNSVMEIHRNERISAKTRKELFKDNKSKWAMGWVNVIVPNSDYPKRLS